MYYYMEWWGTPMLPPELVSEIADCLDNEHHPTVRYRALQACALVSRYFYQEFSPRLFSRIVIQDRPKEKGTTLPSLEQFADLLQFRPSIGQQVRSFKITIQVNDQVNRPRVLPKTSILLPVVLGALGENLQHLHLQATVWGRWDQLDSKVHVAVHRLCGLSTLSKLTLQSWRGVPVSIFASRPNIASLSLDTVEIAPPLDGLPHVAPIATLQELNLVTCSRFETFLNHYAGALANLRRFTCDVVAPNVPAVQSTLLLSSQLEVFECKGCGSTPPGSSEEISPCMGPFNLSTNHQLRILRFRYFSPSGSLRDFCEKIDLIFTVVNEKALLKLLMPVSWTPLEDILQGSGAFRNLKKFNIVLAGLKTFPSNLSQTTIQSLQDTGRLLFPKFVTSSKITYIIQTAA
ncbi:hypothetical protein FA15DRAFT_148335 [Coprinopsis marcescibilis]|uniref:F-box domain-containing protein n=1 Tax=Coprinopsis marcescibilis TaxID=230819 RepID=A0A5C3L558_COPMA|nr:hypothetical protein FA15DRAFT_148335 [Coprinopsis marcescibilis]